MTKRTMTKAGADRFAEKLQRLAYELEYDASRLREWKPSYADAVRSISSRIGDLARNIKAEIT